VRASRSQAAARPGAAKSARPNGVKFATVRRLD